MAGNKRLTPRVGIALTAIFIGMLICLFHLNTQAGDQNLRPDIVMIDLPPVPDGEQMPAVPFLHDLHTAANEKPNDCSTCHPKTDESFLFKFKRTENSGSKIDMAIYHDNCIGCHQETIAAGKAAGPIVGECRACHNQKPEATLSWQSIKFNKSLHYRHESTGLILSSQLNSDTNCGACHHNFDEKAQKTTYIKGEEANCRYCHKEETTELFPTVQTRSMKMASHFACINCHQKLVSASKKAGPVQCAGCHDQAEQKKIEVIQNVPRLKRNQPDVILLLSKEDALQTDEKKSNQNQQPAVAFNHQAHESKTADCITCHHDSLKSCRDCHTSKGDKKGGFVRLETAMHANQTQKSCVGCHAQAQQDRNCAGCHDALPRKTLNNLNCKSCHNVDPAPMESFPNDTAQKMALAQSALNAKTSLPVLPNIVDIPETVTIGVMADQYEAVSLPHGKIIRSLAEGMDNNKMARFFHHEPATMCMGCHHNSPASTKPPKCASCHGEAFKTGDDERPGLMGAYHGQCLSCHQIMQIEEPKATDCVACHKKRS